MTVRFSVTVRQVREDGSEAPLDGELAAALAGPAEQFAPPPDPWTPPDDATPAPQGHPQRRGTTDLRVEGFPCLRRYGAVGSRTEA